MKNITSMLDEYAQTKSIALAAEICDKLIEDAGKAAAELYSEPTIEEAPGEMPSPTGKCRLRSGGRLIDGDDCGVYTYELVAPGQIEVMGTNGCNVVEDYGENTFMALFEILEEAPCK